jgi:hypothetical protein
LTGYFVQIGSTCFKDAAGNYFAGISDATIWNFTSADTVAPTVTSFNPADNATGIGATSSLLIIFSENVVKGETGDIVIRNASDASEFETIAVTSPKVTVSDNVVTIDPAGTFASLTGYFVQIGSTCFKDAAGNYFAGISDATIWNFTSAEMIYTITASAGAGGSISPSGTVTVNHGGSQTFTITRNSCYEVSDVVVDGVSQGAITSYTFNDVSSNHTIHATFVPTGVTITTVSPLPEGIVGTVYNKALSATCYDLYLSWSIQSGSLPAGLDMNTSGVISGTPTTAGTYTFTVQVVEKLVPPDKPPIIISSDTKEFSLTINPLPVISGQVYKWYQLMGGWIKLGIPNVNVYFSGGVGTATTDTSGYYSKTVSYNWSGTVVPDSSTVLYNFSPSYRTYGSVSSDITSQDYTASTRNICFVIQPVNSSSGSSFTVKVILADEYGSPIPGVLVLIAMGANPGGGTLTGGGSFLTGQDGTLTRNLSINMPGVGYTIIASAAGNTNTASSRPFDIN